MTLGSFAVDCHGVWAKLATALKASRLLGFEASRADSLMNPPSSSLNLVQSGPKSWAIGPQDLNLPP